MVMLSLTLSGQLPWSCAMTAIRSRSGSPSTSAIATSSQRTVPACGRYSPARILASVVFPDPFSPTRATTSPRPISIDTSCSDGLVRPRVAEGDARRDDPGRTPAGRRPRPARGILARASSQNDM